MKLNQAKPNQSGSIAAYFVFVLIFLSVLSAVAAYVSHTTRMAHRRADMVRALEFAQGAAVVAGFDLEKAFTNRTRTFHENLVYYSAAAYALKQQGAQEKMYERVITAPFSSQAVTAQLWMTNAASPPFARIVTTAKVGNVSQTAILNVKMSFGLGAAVISDHPGTTSTSISRGAAQDGNVVVDGDKNGPTVIDGGPALAVLANGRVNLDSAYASVPPNAISMTNYNTADQVPDYTADGSGDQLFDFNRFIAVADMAGTHYTNLNQFFLSNNVASLLPNGALEGVIVVDVKKSDPNWGKLNPTSLPRGINVRGTLILNFGSDVGPSDKIVNTAAMNINPANLTGMNPRNPKTYTTGYPPSYTNPALQPWNFDISSKGFANFTPVDDFPALMYNIGVLDMHGNANICGSLYTPGFVEIENKADFQTQYIKGSIIAGGGVFIENRTKSASVISYDPAAVDFLATSSNKGKKVVAMFWK